MIPNNMASDKNRRVLVIDDVRSIHDDFRRILSPGLANAAVFYAADAALFGQPKEAIRETHFEVDSAYQGEEGVLLLKKALEAGRPYALAFVDVRMPPGWDGVETTLKMWELDPKLQVVICTADSKYSWAEIIERLGQRDGLLILKKPFDAVEAFQLAHALTEKWQLRQQSQRRMEDLENQVAERTRQLQEANYALQDEVVGHQRSEKRLSESEALLTNAQRIAHLGYWERDFGRHRLRWSDEVHQIFDVPPDRFNGTYQAFLDCVHPDDRALVQRWHDDLMASREALRLEHRIVRPDGTIRWVREQAELGLDAEGKPARLFGTALDITEQHHAEQAMRESEERFRATFEQAAVGISHVGPDGRFLRVNDKLCEITGYARNELLQRTFQELALAEELPQAEEAFRSMLAGERHSFSIERPYRRKNGDVFWANVVTTLLRAATGEPKYFISVIQDITPRKQAENSLRESNEKFHLLADNITDAFWIRSPDMRELHYISPAFALIWGRSAEILHANPELWAEFILPDDRERVRDAFAGLTGDKANLDIEYRIVRPGGELRWVRVRVFQVRDTTGKLIRLTGIVTDMTEHKRIEAQLFQSQKMETVGRLAGGVAHEFNNIMTAILGQSELLLGDVPAGSSLAKNVAEISKAAGRAATLTRQLLAYGRKQFLQPEILDLNSVLAGMEGALHHLMARGLEVRIAPADGLNEVRADAGQIEQVIMNMAANAVDAMPDGGRLTLETANVTLGPEDAGHIPELKAGAYVMLAITDTGTGMSEEVRARIFEPFFTTKGVGEGTGLGLATCYGIVKQSGGHISVDTELGRGTKFKIYLPQVEQQTTIPGQRGDSPDLPRGTETILLVEKDPVLREMAAILLRRLGYTVLEAANGLEALKQHRDIRHIDLLFTDLVMPQMSGKELSERVRALYPPARFLFASTHPRNAIVDPGVLDEGMALLQKPFTPSALAHKLREVLDQPSDSKPDTEQKIIGISKIADGA